MKWFVLLVGIVFLAACSPQAAEPVAADVDYFDLLAFVDSQQISRISLQNTIAEIGATKDEQYIVPLIDLLRFPQLGISGPTIDALREITGERINEWGDWMIYIANRDDIVLPDRYLDWKAKLYSIIDPNFGLFFADGKEQSDSFRPELAVWGGVRVAISPGVDNGIPPLENPAVIAGSAASFMRADDVVYGVVIDGVARAYPQRIVDWHEMVNDNINGRPFSVAYCTLCGAAVVYDTQHDDDFFTFSSSGLLYESNKLMFDRQTETLWNHITGEPVLGELVGEIDRLPRLPIETTLWSDWLALHPETEVVSLDTGFNRDYSFGVPSYNNYYASPETLFPTSDVPGPFVAKDRIFALLEGDAQKAYLRNDVWEQNVINDQFNGRNIVVVSRGENFGIRAYEAANYEFTLTENFELLDENGDVWTIGDEALTMGAESLARLPAHEAFWFGWVIFYPDTEAYQ